MASKRKQKSREDELFETGGWFALSDDMWKDPGEKRKKLRMVADANFPIALVNSLKNRGIEVKTAQELRLEKLPDEELLRRVLELGHLLITMDGDFWSDGKFPLHKAGGVVFVDGEDEGIGNTEGFELLLAYLESFGGGWRKGKIRAASDRIYTKIVGHEGKRVMYEIKGFRPLIYAREVLS